MIPVVLGWVYVGTQTSAGSIKAAIASISVPVLGSERDVTGECIGIHDRTVFDNSCTRLWDSGHPQLDLGEQLQSVLAHEHYSSPSSYTFLAFPYRWL